MSDPEVRHLVELARQSQAETIAADVTRFLQNKGQLATYFADTLFKPTPDGFRGWSQDVAQRLGIELAPRPAGPAPQGRVGSIDEIAEKYDAQPERAASIDLDQIQGWVSGRGEAPRGPASENAQPAPELAAMVRQLVWSAIQEYDAQRQQQVAQQYPQMPMMPQPMFPQPFGSSPGPTTGRPVYRPLANWTGGNGWGRQG